jgi:hypothetical protein
MDLKDTSNMDSAYQEIVVLFNAQPEAITFTDQTFVGKNFALHPIQQSSVDATVHESKYDSNAGEFTVPGRTTAVFVIARDLVSTPTVVATETTPTSVNSSGILITAGVITALIIVVVGLFALRRKPK